MAEVTSGTSSDPLTVIVLNEAEANAEYERLLEVRRGEIGWSREGGVYHPEWAITVYKPMEVRHGE